MFIKLITYIYLIIQIYNFVNYNKAEKYYSNIYLI